MIGLLRLDFLNLAVNFLVVGGSFHIAYNAESHREIGTFHKRKFQVQCRVGRVGIVNQKVLFGNSVFTEFHYFYAEAVLHKSEFVVRTKDHGLTFAQINGVSLAGFLGINVIV